MIPSPSSDAFDAAALAAWEAAGSHFQHRGHSIFLSAAERGRRGGDTLVCIHGFPTASFDWQPLWESLSSRFGTVLAPDMIGFGLSDKPRFYPYSILDQADLFEALLRSRGIARFHILAHDYGDTVAQELLARHEARLAAGDESLRIESVCLLNGGLFPEVHRAVRVQKLLLTPIGPLIAWLMNERSFMPRFAAVFGPHTQPSNEELHLFWSLIARQRGAQIMHRLIRYIPERLKHRERWVGALTRTRVPLRLIDGALDPISGAHMAERYRELVPNPDVILLPTIGHYPQVEAPDAVLSAFVEFHDHLRATA